MKQSQSSFSGRFLSNRRLTPLVQDSVGNEDQETPCALTTKHQLIRPRRSFRLPILQEMPVDVDCDLDGTVAQLAEKCECGESRESISSSVI
jgi:hypothetical protein